MTLTRQQKAKLDAQLDRWQQDLVNLTKRNKLLFFKHAKTASLEIVAPSMSQIEAGLSDPGWTFRIPPDPKEDITPRPRKATELETTKRTRNELLNSLKNLERTTSQTHLDTGLWVLYLGYGMLTWTEVDGGDPVESPLLLQPAVLARPNSPTEFTLKASDDDAVVNPALAIKLANDFDISLPTIDDVDGGPGAVLREVGRRIGNRPGWRVDERVVLTTFTFHKEAMYRDLLTNRKEIAEHPLVQIAAIGSSAGADRFDFVPPTEDELETLLPPEDLVSILDADSTQRKCIVAAREGRSFVMDGPPGTGKSQTIANVIAELLHLGKSVLFVSEKAAALEVVANRLKNQRLGEFILELHSHKATRKELALELGRALELSPQASSKFTNTDRSQLVRIREQLNNYAIAVNQRREPLGRSLHQVIGRTLELQESPHAPVARVADASMTAEFLAHVVATAEQLGRAWKPVSVGDDFLWRSLRDTAFSAGRQQEIERLIAECRDAVERIQEVSSLFDTSLGLGWRSTPADVDRLFRLLSLTEAHPRRGELPVAWLTQTDLQSVIALVNSRRQHVSRLLNLYDTAQRLGGDSWRGTPLGAARTARNALKGLDATSQPFTLSPDARVNSVSQVLDLWADVEKHVAELQSDAHTVASAFGISAAGLSAARCSELAELTGLMGSTTPPEPSWLSPFAQAALTEAVTVLTELVADYRRRRDALSSTFTDQILELDLAGLKARLAANKGLRRLGGTYRADKKTLAGCVLTGKVTPAVIERLDDAVAWRELRDRLTSAESTHSQLLGSYYEGPLATDLDRIERALSVAQRAVALCGTTIPPEVSKQVARGATPSAEAQDAGERLRRNLEIWRLQIEPRLSQFGVDGSGQSLALLVSLVSTTRQDLETLRRVVVEANAATGRDLTVLDAVQLSEHAEEIHESEQYLESVALADAALLGPSWAGIASDFDVLEADLEWARRVVATAGGPLDESAASYLITMPETAESLGLQLGAVTKSWQAIADQFQSPWREHLSADFVASLESGLALLDDLGATTADIEVWTRHAIARQELTDAGLGDVVTFLEAQRVSGDQVAPAVERSMLENWVDAVMSADSRLKQLNPSDRADLVTKFQRLDRELVANAAAKVINACAERRPATALGVSGIIRREAQKRTRHKPIRVLLSETREVTLALKPCFMMSPLSVSQFLPPNFTFDVVIFDEASQVKPSDAVNCIYRGHQLIVAGDPRQLPPSNFFEHMAEEGTDDYDDEAPEDFESVLDVFLGSGIPSLPLQWHYRSQHESLITYSNYRFYDGRLHTFPGAVEQAQDVGVEMFKVAGVYRRGASRDNPVEAQKVVERVLYHRRNHPQLTLGVVAFSSAQESAIVAEFERQQPTAPEIGELLGGEDRLNGFFVKNLENVQGDERDIIIFSIGYGPDENGKFTEQMGPLGKSGGERRLNVAITRARRRIEVVASIAAGNFPGTSSAAGIRHLQRYLDYAERGVPALALDVVQADADVESVFEEQVLRVIQRLGFDAQPQVGVAGYRIDLGVRHPARPGEFVLGVECDGAAYHSSRVARDRDRLRQEVLEGLDWRLYRIWGPSWFRDPRGQEALLKKAIEHAVNGQQHQPSRAKAVTSTPDVELVEIDLGAPPNWSRTYIASSWKAPSGLGTVVHMVPLQQLATGVAQVVLDEGPVHEDVVRRRLAEAFGVGRIGDRIRTAFDDAIEHTIRQKSVERIERVFLQKPGTAVAVRLPDEDDERTRRKIAEVSTVERRLAITSLVSDSHRVSRDDLKVGFGRLFGWKRVGPEIDTTFERDVTQLLKGKALAKDSNGMLFVP